MSETKIVPEYSQDRTQGNLELAVVVPTFNEIENIVAIDETPCRPRWKGMRSKSSSSTTTVPMERPIKSGKSPSATSESAASNESAAVG